jgi:hypothetical protein
MKTHYTILFFNNGYKERINVALVMFNDEKCIVEVNKNKMDFVKTFKPPSFHLFKYSIDAFRLFYNDKKPITYFEINKLCRENNGLFMLDSPSFIDVKLTQDNFDKLYNKIIAL